MRITRNLASIAVLALLLCTSVALAQTVPATAVPFISEVSPPSLPAASTAPGNGNFTLTILGANFQSNSAVNLSFPGGTPVPASSTTVNAGGSQIVAQFTNAILPTPATLLVTVTNPNGTPPSTSNAYYLPETPAQTSVELNQNTTSSLPGTPSGIVVANLRASGLPDFAVVSQSSNTVTVEWSDFNGPFLAGGTYTTGNNPSGIAAVDFFGTGQLGLAVVNSGDNTISMLLPNGDGTFRPGNTISLPGIYPTQLVAADFNGDGKIDLAVLNTCGSGPAVSCFPAPAPFPGSVTILLGNGDGTFSISRTEPTTGHNPSAIATADLNGDGILDLIVVNTPDNNLTLLMGNGDGTFTPTTVSPLTGNSPRTLAIGDFDGDGYPDIAVTDATDSAVAILLNQQCPLLPLQQCAFAAPVSISTGAYPLAIATADMNADGFLDLVVVNGDSYSVSVLLGDGKGGFTPAVPQSGPNFSTGTLPAGVVLGDFNQDGRLDIVTMNTSGSYSYLRQAAVAQIVVTTDLANPIYGQAPNLTATLNPPPGSAAPTGTFTFYDGSTPIGTVPLSGYRAVLQYSGLSAGTHQVTAVYAGDTNFASVTSNAVTETVSTAQTTTTLNSNVSNAAYGSPVTLTAAVQPQAGGGTATGSISFIDTTTSTDVGNVTLVNNSAQLTLSNLPAGTHVLVANYPGDANLNPSSSANVTLTVTQASSTTTLTSNINPSTFNQQITLSVTIQPSPSATATGTVSFYDGASLLGTVTLANNVALFQTTTLAGGSHSISARYSGDANTTASTSSVLLQTVNPATSTTTVSASLNPSIYGQSVVFTSSVRSAISQLSEGQVSLYDGSTLLGTVNLATNAPVFIPNYLKAGTRSITAQYSGTSNYAPSSSTPLTQTVNQDTTTTTVAALPNPSSVGQTVNVTVGVNPAHNYGSSGGTVTLYDSGTSIGTAILSMASSVSFTFTGQTPGTHTLTASYGGDSNLIASTSANFTQTVNPAPTTNSLSLSSNATTYGQSVTITSTIHPAFSGPPTGTVTFLDGSTTLSTVALASGSAQFTTSSLSVASHSITAKYSGDSNFSASTSSPQTLTVNPTPTTTTASVDINPATYAQTVTLSATIELSSGTGATGSISFFDGSTSLGTVPLSNGSAQLPVSSLAAGSHSITAKYSGDANFAASTSTALTETVNPAATSTSVSSSANPAIVGQSITFTATVQPPVGTSATGTINFLDGTTSLGTATLANNNTLLTVSTLAVGTHTITAAYSGSTNFAASTSAVLTETVNQAPTTTTVTATPNPSVFNQSLIFAITISAAAGGTPTGTVTLMDGSTNLTTATLSGGGTHIYYGGLSPATHSITAVYSGDPNFTGSTSAAQDVVVNQASSTTSLSSSLNPSTYGQSVTLTATVQAPQGIFPFGTVTFMDGSATLGSSSLSNGSAQFTLSGLAAGSHTITAVYAGNTYLTGSTSTGLAQSVIAASSAATVSSSVNPAVFGQTVVLSAAIKPAFGGSATGTVTFLDGAVALGSSSVSGNAAQLSLSSLAVGSHSITVKYSGDNNVAGTTSTALAQTVSQAATTTTVTSGSNPAVFGQSVTFSVRIQSPSSGTPTGTVALTDGPSSLGSTALTANGMLQFTISSLAAGAHAISASYSGDANYGGSTSSVLTETVNPASSTVSITASPNPTAFGQAVMLTASVTPSVSGDQASGAVTFFDGSTSLGTANLSNNSAQLSVSNLAAGSHFITANYSGDANFGGSTSAALAETVNQVSTTTTLVSSLNPAVAGQSVTFTATVQAGAGNSAAGTVSFMDGSSTLGTVTLASNSAQLTVSTFTVGAHSVTAVYSGSIDFSSSTSAVLTETVNQVATTTTVASSLNPAPFGQAVTLTATVQAGSGISVAGTVTFLDGSLGLGTVTLANNSAQLNTSTLAPGAHAITAVYNSNGNFAGSTSAALTETVNPLSTTTTLTSNANPALAGQSVTFTANVQAGTGNSPAGTVTFLDGSTTLGSMAVTNNSAQLTISTLAPGSHSITAAYGGSTDFAASTSSALTETMNQSGTTTTLVSNLNPATFGQGVPFVATVQTASGGAATGTVTFFDGATALGTATVSNSGGHNVAQLTFSGLLGGTHTITASYNGDANYIASTSSAMTETVNPASSTVMVGANPNPGSFGQAVVLTATVAPSVSGTLATGTVTFFDGSSSLGTANLSNNVAQISVANLALGSHSITANYAGDRNFTGCTSAALSEAVNPAATATVVTSSANPAIVKTAATFTATVSSSSAGTQSGTVNFYLDGSSTAAASVSLSNGMAQYSTNSLSAGSHSVVAIFTSSNPDFSGSTSAAFTQFISDFTVAVSPGSLTVARGTSGTYTLTLTPVGEFSGTVSLSCGGAPGGTTCAISPTQVTLSGSGSVQATVTITAAQNASKGTHTLTFTGTSGGLNHKITASLTID